MESEAPGPSTLAPKGPVTRVRGRHRYLLTSLLGGLAVSVAALAAPAPDHTATAVQQAPFQTAGGHGTQAEVRPAATAHTTALPPETLAEGAEPLFRAPGSTASPAAAPWSVGGPALGLALGLSAALVRRRLDPVLRDRKQAERLAGRPVLMDLPVSDHLDEAPCVPHGQHTPAGRHADARAHLLRARLAELPDLPDGPHVPGGLHAPSEQHSTDGRHAPDEQHTPAEQHTCTLPGSGHRANRGRTVLVASVTPGRSGPRAAVDLAAALARTGSETLLVCSAPSPAPLGLPEGPGLAEAFLEGQDPAALAVYPDHPQRLRVLRHGCPGTTAPAQDADVLRELLEPVRTDVEHTLLTSTSGSGCAGVQALLGTVDALVPVAEIGRSRREDLAALLRAAELAGTPVPGVVALTPARSGPAAPEVSAVSADPTDAVGPGRADALPASAGTAPEQAPDPHAPAPSEASEHDRPHGGPGAQ